MPNILVTAPVMEHHKTYLEAIAKDYTFTYADVQSVTEEQVCAADIIIGNPAPALVAKSERLKWIQLTSAGADPYCKPGIIKPGTLMTCSIGAYGLTVSEGMLAMTYALTRKLDLYLRNQAEHRWQMEGKVCSIWGSTTLVIGLGDIGTEYAQRMKALGSTVLGIRRNTAVKPDCVDEVYSMEQLDELLPRADYVAMALPSTAQTRRIINEDRLRRMKPGAYLINAGRGDAVDCDALNKVLREGTSLGGAALDVTSPEPLPADHPLWDAPRCIIMPHVAGHFFLQETLERAVKIAGTNLERFLSGNTDALRNLVDPTTGSCRK